MPPTAEAVMAGCLPMPFPVVLTAWSGMLQDSFLLRSAPGDRQ